MPARKGKHQHLLLREAMYEVESADAEDEELHVVILPPDNTENGDTDVEAGNESDLEETSLGSVLEVAGTLEVQSSKQTSKVKAAKQLLEEKKKKPSANTFREERKKIKEAALKRKEVIDVYNCNQPVDEKVKALIKRASDLEQLHIWEAGGMSKSELEWRNEMSVENKKNFDKLYEDLGGKLPAEVFDKLFSDDLKSCIRRESERYASVVHNDVSYRMTNDSLMQFVSILLLSGYHALPQQHLYWERSHDVQLPFVYENISKNRFLQDKKYLHFADNDNLEKTDKFAKIRPLYDLANKSLKQYGFWDKDYSIDEQMVPYYGMHSAKQTMRNKGIRFGYKNFVLSSSDGYPYTFIPYGGAKGIAGTPGKDLTMRVILNLVIGSEGGVGNLAFDNWYASTKLLSALSAMNIPTVCTVRSDRVGDAMMSSDQQMKKKERGEYEYMYDKNLGLHLVKWNDNSVVNCLSNCIGVHPLEGVDRFSRKDRKTISILLPHLLKLYNQIMGGVDMVDGAVAAYRIKVKGKKWWWPHFTNMISVLIAASWRIYKALNPDEDQTLLTFVRSVVLSNMHRDRIKPQFWKTKAVVMQAEKASGNHWPNVRPNQRRCARKECKSRPRTYCEVCQVALCIEGCFKKYHQEGQ